MNRHVVCIHVHQSDCIELQLMCGLCQGQTWSISGSAMQRSMEKLQWLWCCS